MSVLIFGHVNDEHAAAVCEALTKEGIKTSIFCNDEYPRNSTVSVSPYSGNIDLIGSSIDNKFEQFKTVWNRRKKKPLLHINVHDDDKPVAMSECEIFLQELRIVSYKNQVWVNSEVSQLLIRGKTNQLFLARDVGMNIPNTLISNNPHDVRAFLSKNKSSIVKAVDKMGWIEDGIEIALPTSQIFIENCDDDVSIRLCPMIYQEQIRKAFELRVVVFGDHILFVKLDSQGDDVSRVDWRNAEPNSFSIEEFDPPEKLVKDIRTFCRRAGVLHGSFDFAVDHDGNAIFFEFNVQGQFLWIEDWNPSIRVLDRMVEFLKSPTRGYNYSGVKQHSFKDFIGDWAKPQSHF